MSDSREDDKPTKKQITEKQKEARKQNLAKGRAIRKELLKEKEQNKYDIDDSESETDTESESESSDSEEYVLQKKSKKEKKKPVKRSTESHGIKKMQKDLDYVKNGLGEVIKKLKKVKRPKTVTQVSFPKPEAKTETKLTANHTPSISDLIRTIRGPN